MALDELPHDGQPQAEPLVRARHARVRLLERREDVREHVRLDALARVGHGQARDYDHLERTVAAALTEPRTRRGITL